MIKIAIMRVLQSIVSLSQSYNCLVELIVYGKLNVLSYTYASSLCYIC